jgi:hypothetical protein
MADASISLIIATVAALAAVTVAIITGAFSIIGLVVSKEQKVSEFRQIWIDALREDIAEVVAQINMIHAGLLKLAKEKPKDTKIFGEKYGPHYILANRSAMRIKLRLNRKEAAHTAILKTLGELETLFLKNPEDLADSQDEIGPLNDRLELEAAATLKDEWEQVKRGERQYRVVKWGITFLILLLLAFICLGGIRLRRLGLFNQQPCRVPHISL